MPLYKVEYTYDYPSSAEIIIEAESLQDVERVALIQIEEVYAGLHQDPFVETIEELDVKETV